jgi:bifunctional NMN adenylyltransferase/nudix hydrolase
MTKFDYAVYIGRFQPFHNGHQATLEFGLKVANKAIIMLGSPFEARTIKNPFSADEREMMIRAVMRSEEDRLVFRTAKDYPFDNQEWVDNITGKVMGVAREDEIENPKCALIGVKKDQSSFYLDLFPNWTNIEPPVEFLVNSTDIRESFFGLTDIFHPEFYTKMAPETRLFLERFRASSAFEKLFEDFLYYKNYKRSWSAAPFPPTLVTADALITHKERSFDTNKSGSIALVRRKDAPGRGLLALPGGFVEQSETTFEAAVRETREEIGIDLTLWGYGDSEWSEVIDKPDRSLRGRVITHVHRFALDDYPLPDLKAGDDAAEAIWFPINRVEECRHEFFDDHYHIIRNFT